MLLPAVPWTYPVYLKLVKSVKMQKHKTVYKPECCKEVTFITKSARAEFHAFCKLCQANLDVSTKWKGAIERHATTDKHKTNNHVLVNYPLLHFLLVRQLQLMTKHPLASCAKYIMQWNITNPKVVWIVEWNLRGGYMRTHHLLKFWPVEKPRQKHYAQMY